MTNGETTDLNIETDKHGVIAGAARQLYGSSSLRTSGGNNKQTKRRKNNHSSATSTTHQPKFHDLDDDDYDGDDQISHGILITEPHPVPPPFDPSFRVIGGVRVPGIESEIYGARQVRNRFSAHFKIVLNWNQCMHFLGWATRWCRRQLENMGSFRCKNRSNERIKLCIGYASRRWFYAYAK